MELIVVRHAENALPPQSAKITSNLLNVSSLTERGRIQADHLARTLKRLPEVNNTILFSSPSQRCSETADRLAEQLDIEVSVAADLDDRSIGNHTFANLDEYRTWQLNAWESPRNSTEGAESLSQQRTRVSRLLRRLLAGSTADRVILVTHGSTIEHLSGILLRIPVASMRSAFISCSHAHFHVWEVNVADNTRTTILRSVNTSPNAIEASAANVEDPYKAMSERIGGGKHVKGPNMPVYYVR